jgi:hypothetical protein
MSRFFPGDKVRATSKHNRARLRYCSALLRITARPLVRHVTNATGDDTFQGELGERPASLVRPMIAAKNIAGKAACGKQA